MQGEFFLWTNFLVSIHYHIYPEDECKRCSKRQYYTLSLILCVQVPIKILMLLYYFNCFYFSILINDEDSTGIFRPLTFKHFNILLIMETISEAIRNVVIMSYC